MLSLELKNTTSYNKSVHNPSSFERLLAKLLNNRQAFEAICRMSLPFAA
jgi:hypothetical protein